MKITEELLYQILLELRKLNDYFKVGEEE